MRKALLMLAAAAALLSACGGPAAPVDPNAPQQAQSSGVNPWLAGALGFFAGRAMSGGGSSSAAAPSHNTTVINRRTVIVQQYPEPSKLKAPEVKTAPIVPPPAPKAAFVPPKPTFTATPKYSGPNSYRAPTTSFRSSPSTGRR